MRHALSTHSTQVISPTSGHRLPHDDPSLIVKVIGSVVEQVRQRVRTAKADAATFHRRM
jgi:hypothetical protein